MPSVKLSRYECSRDMLPDVCMFCGEPATVRKRKTFGWHPGWVWILILVNLIVLIVVAMILTKKMPMKVPLCERHAGYWTRRTLTLTFSFLAVAVLCIGAGVYMDAQPVGQRDDLGGILCGGGVVLFLGWLIFAAIYSSSGVRPTEITDKAIRLTGVNEAFIDALEEERSRDRSERERSRYGDERDDYDDQSDREPPRRRSYEDDDYRPRRRPIDDEPDDRPRGRRDEDDDDRPRRRSRDDD
jgi:hypothetical protein